MTRQYRIQKVTGEPDWDKIEKAPLDQRLWRPCEAISAYAQLAYDEIRLYVHLHAKEAQIRAENSGVLDQPCQDSCLEFFLSAAECDARYLNIELNPNLCLYFGFGTGRVDRMRLLLPGGGKTLNACCERTATGWDVAYELPFKLLQLDAACAAIWKIEPWKQRSFHQRASRRVAFRILPLERDVGICQRRTGGKRPPRIAAAFSGLGRLCLHISQKNRLLSRDSGGFALNQSMQRRFDRCCGSVLFLQQMIY